jgi:DNA replication licensing factor MCM4
MSSPPALDFPTSDEIEMTSVEEGQTRPDAPPLFLAGTPSAAGTPARLWASDDGSQAGNTPMQGLMARRAVGMSTPKRTPLFNRKPVTSLQLAVLLTIDIAGSSSPMAFPSSSPAKNVSGRATLNSGAPFDSDPLDFPSCVDCFKTTYYN